MSKHKRHKVKQSIWKRIVAWFTAFQKDLTVGPPSHVESPSPMIIPTSKKKVVKKKTK